MIIQVKHSAQMCNRIWSLVPILAYALHTKTHICVLFGNKSYINCFPLLRKCKYLHFLFSHNSVTPKYLEWKLVLFSEKYNLEIKDELKNNIHTEFISFIDGWYHRADISFIIEQKKEIINLFQPSIDVTKKVDTYFNNYEGITIGIHARRGDYINFVGGKYYYSDEVYIQAMSRMRKLFTDTRKTIRFLFCSNEHSDIPTSYNDVFAIDHSDGITDLYALSRCNYIIGPPSSYSQWASFYGEVPLLFLLNESMEFTLDSFAKITLFNCFANGKQLKMRNDVEYYIE